MQISLRRQGLYVAVVLLNWAIVQSPIRAENRNPTKDSTTSRQAKHSNGRKPVISKSGKEEQKPRKRVQPASAALTRGSRAEIRSLEEKFATQQNLITAQQKQIEELRSTMERQTRVMEEALRMAQSSAPVSAPQNLGQFASLGPPALPRATTTNVPSLPSPAAPPAATRAEVQETNIRVDELGKKVETALSGLGGFRFNGDLRFRTDMQLRTGNDVAGPLQNVRERYRLRFNVNKAITDNFDVHVQLGSGTFNNPLTLDTDFAGTVNRGPIFITEFYAAYHNKNLELRGGKMEEVFADNSRFFFDDDVRFNGFHQIVRFPFSKNSLGISRFELRAGEYILTNPNIVILPSSAQCASPTPPVNCFFVSAGAPAGGKARDTQVFHPGFAVFGNIKEGWTHQFFGDFQVYRNPGQIQFASTTNGFPVLVNGYYGLALAGPVGQAGNATTTPGGAIYTARNFQIARLNYRVTHTGWKTHHQAVPVWLDLQAARNIGTSFERNAYMATLNVGEVKRFGDVRFMYIYGVKQANSMISQLTDDDLGTGTGVNLRTHLFRVDLGLTKFLQWQNLVFVQEELSPNDPARLFFVPLQKGANTTYRIHSQFQINF